MENWIAARAAAVAFSVALAAPAGAVPALFDGGLVVVGQASDADEADAEVTASLNLLTRLEMGPGAWMLFVEGNTSPRSGGVSAALPEVNSHAGSALDRDGNGRLQVSEFVYVVPIRAGGVAVGLVDVTAYLDASEVANDEGSQFLAAALVNNPTVGFPDYTLGGVYARLPAGEGPGWVLAVTGSNGLADNPDASYTQLVDVSAHGKGVFSALELQWQHALDVYRLGGWWSTADHEALHGSGSDLDSRGVYLSADWMWGSAGLNLRAGWARESISEAARFVAVALRLRADVGVFGAGWAWTGASDGLGDGAEDTHQTEVYLRMELAHDLHLTPSVQWIQHSALGGSPAGDDAFVGSLRVGVTY